MSSRGIHLSGGRLTALLALGLMAFAAGCSGQQSAPKSNQPVSGEKPVAQQQPPAKAPDKVQVFWGWTFSGQVLPTIVGMEKGYFAKNGIEVEYIEGNGSGNMVKAVANKSATFGVGDVASAILLKAKDKVPVKVVAVQSQSSVNVMVSPADKPLTRAKDLVGKTVAFTASDSIVNLFPGFLKSDGVDPSQVNVVYVDAAAKVTLLRQDKVYASGLSQTFHIPGLKAAGFKFNIINFKDVGMDTFSYGIVVHDDTVAKNPDLVRRFLAAWTESLKFVQDAANRNEVAAIVDKRFPKPGSADILAQWDEVSKLLHTKRTEGKPLLWSDPGDWQDNIRIMEDYMGLPKGTKPDDYYTNDLLPK